MHGIQRLRHVVIQPSSQRSPGVENVSQLRRCGGHLSHGPLKIERLEGVELGTPPRVVAGVPHHAEQAGVVVELAAGGLHLFRLPRLGPREFKLRHRSAFGSQPDQLCQNLIRRQPRGGNHCVHAVNMLIQFVAHLSQTCDRLGQFRRSQRLPELEHSLDLRQHDLLIELVAVQFEAHVADADLLQSPLHHFEGGHLLGHKQNRLATLHRSGDEVGDRLRFAGAGWSLDDEVAPHGGFSDDQGLRAITVDDMARRGRGEQVVEPLAVFDQWRGSGEPLAEQGADQRAIGEFVLFGPVGRVEVAVHQELGEREEPEHHVIGQDLPRLLVLHRCGDLLQVHRRNEILHLFGRGGQVDSKVYLQPGPQRQIRFDVIAGVDQIESRSGTRSFEADRDDQQRGKSRCAWIVSLKPLQEPDGQVQDVDPLLLKRGGRVGVQTEQPPVEFLGIEYGVKYRVALPLFVGDRFRGGSHLRDREGLLGDPLGGGFRCCGRSRLLRGPLLGSVVCLCIRQRFFGQRFRFGGALVLGGYHGCEFTLLKPHRLGIGDEQAKHLVCQFVFDFQAQARVLIPLRIQQAILCRQLQQITPRDFQLLEKLVTRGHRGIQIVCIDRGEVEMLPQADSVRIRNGEGVTGCVQP